MHWVLTWCSRTSKIKTRKHRGPCSKAGGLPHSGGLVQNQQDLPTISNSPSRSLWAPVILRRTLHTASAPKHLTTPRSPFPRQRWGWSPPLNDSFIYLLFQAHNIDHFIRSSNHLLLTSQLVSGWAGIWTWGWWFYSSCSSTSGDWHPENPSCRLDSATYRPCDLEQMTSFCWVSVSFTIKWKLYTNIDYLTESSWRLNMTYMWKWHMNVGIPMKAEKVLFAVEALWLSIAICSQLEFISSRDSTSSIWPVSQLVSAIPCHLWRSFISSCGLLIISFFLVCLDIRHGFPPSCLIKEAKFCDLIFFRMNDFGGWERAH